MSSNKISLVSIIVALFLATALPALCENQPGQSGRVENQCADLLKDCFKATGLQRTNCFYSAATHPFCDGTELGRLSYSRWVMSPVDTDGMGSPPAFLGPKVVNEECVRAFDARWQTAIENGQLSEDSVRQLNSKLAECKRDTTIHLQRP